MNLLIFLLTSSVLSFLVNSPSLGLVVAAVTVVWLACLAWSQRHVPYDPRDY